MTALKPSHLRALQEFGAEMLVMMGEEILLLKHSEEEPLEGQTVVEVETPSSGMVFHNYGPGIQVIIAQKECTFNFYNELETSSRPKVVIARCRPEKGRVEQTEPEVT